MVASWDDILTFWYTPETRPTRDEPFGRHRAEWFKAEQSFDRQIGDRFLSTYEAAARSGLDGWIETAEGALALTIVLDQFPRNIFRDSPKAFATDEKALRVAQEAITRKHDKVLSGVEKLFIYMPFQHSENADIQRQSAELYRDIGNEQSLNSARRHCEIILRFGRFPHRNAVLGRPSTAEEETFLLEPNSSF